MTKHPDIFAALAAPFPESELKSRQGGKGGQFTYVTARTVMNKLDSVLGPENWWDDYSVGGESSILCRLTIRLPDGSTLTKCDAGGFAGMADQGDDDKSGYSDAFKRAAVKHGVGRYLYRDGVPSYSREPGDDPVEAEHASPAPAPASARPANGKPRDVWGPSKAAAAPAPRASGNERRDPPATGKALFAWAKDQEQRHHVELVKYLNGLGKLEEFPSRMIEWDGSQVARAYAEACRKLQSTPA